MRKVLVTGAEGFIGSHLTERLVREGCAVRAMSLYNSFNSAGWLDIVPKNVRSEIEILMSDVRDPNAMRQAVKGCDTVLHLAALIAIPYSYHAPDSYVDTNIRGTVNVLQAARSPVYFTRGGVHDLFHPRIARGLQDVDRAADIGIDV